MSWISIGSVSLRCFHESTTYIFVDKKTKIGTEEMPLSMVLVWTQTGMIRNSPYNYISRHKMCGISPRRSISENSH